MSKRTKEKRKALAKQRRKHKQRSVRQRDRQAGQPALSVSPLSLIRVAQYSPQSRAVFEDAVPKLVAGAPPLEREHYKEMIARIQAVEALAELINLLDEIDGPPVFVWSERLREFGDTAAAPLGDYLRVRHSSVDAERFEELVEHVMPMLRWCGDAGAQVLLDCLETLPNTYGRSIAAVMLGLLNAEQAGDRLWSLYQELKDDDEELFIGPLWGLVDTGDPRAADALVEWIEESRGPFYELTGFASRAGDLRIARFLFAILLASAQVDPQSENTLSYMFALMGIVQRFGVNTVIDYLQGQLEADTPDYDAAITTMRQVVEGLGQSLAHEDGEAEMQRFFEMFYNPELSAKA